jgi:hypothetical protein
MGGGDKSTALRGVAALNVYKKVAIIRSSSDVLSYEGADGNVKTVNDLHLAATATVRFMFYAAIVQYRYSSIVVLFLFAFSSSFLILSFRYNTYITIIIIIIII